MEHSEAVDKYNSETYRWKVTMHFVSCILIKTMLCKGYLLIHIQIPPTGYVGLTLRSTAEGTVTEG